MEREVFALELHRIGEVFIRVRHCPYRISHSVRSAFYGVSGKAARPSISTEAWPTGQRGMTPQQCQQQHPLRSGSEEIAAPNPSTSLSSPIWLTSPASSAFQGAQEHGVQPPRNMAATHGTADGKIA